MRVNNPADYYVGKGAVYFDPMDSDGNLTGQQYLGNTPLYEITPSSEKLEHYSAATRAAELDSSVVTKQKLSVRVQGDQFNKDTLAMVFAGDTTTYSQTGDTVADEAIAGVLQDRFYDLAYRQVSSVVVTDGDTVTYDETDDYVVDATLGRIYIVPGGAITDESDIEVSYTYATASLDVVRGITQTGVRGKLRFVGDPIKGHSFDIEMWDVTLSADGAIGFIAETYQSWSMTGDISADTVNHPDEPHLRVTVFAVGE